MATTVNAAFSEFLRDTVNLDPGVTTRARSSRDWLIGQIHGFPAKHSDFPTLYPAVDLKYGSFARNTKIRELDDVDQIIGISALGTTYVDMGGTVHLAVPDGIALRGLCNDGTNTLNSTKVINRFLRYLDEVPQYSSAETGKDGSAAKLNLNSYAWSFDIIPAFFTTPEWDGRTYYIIPDGRGSWMKTDPRIDQARVSQINQRHDGNVLNALRLVKYWNQRPTMPSVPSYLLECVVLEYYAATYRTASAYVDLEVGPLLDHVATAVLSDVADPKGIEGNLNRLSLDTRFKVSNRASGDARKAAEARTAENAGDHELSIKHWGNIFGPSFPTYG